MRTGRLAVLAVLFPALVGGCDGNSTGPQNGGGNSIAKVSGDNQTGQTGTDLAAPLTVRVTNASGNPASGAGVTWALAQAAGAGSELSSSSTTTGSDGQTSITFTLGESAGTYQVRASITGSSVIFTATASGGGSLTLEIASGNGQVGFTDAALGQALTVRTLGGGAPEEGIEVTFSITEQQGTGASLSAGSATTNAQGLASTDLTLGSGAGRFGITASTGFGSVVLNAHACGGDAGATIQSLAPGEDGVFDTPAGVACIQLPAHTAGAEYEVIVNSLTQDPNDPANLTVAVAGSGAGSSQVAPPALGLLGARAALAPQEQLENAWRTRQYAFDSQLRELEKRILPSYRTPAGPAFGLAAVPSVGDTLDFKFGGGCIDNSVPPFENAPDSVTAVVRTVSAWAVVVEDTAALQAADPFTQAEFDEIGQVFDDLIYAVDTTYFGSPGDIDVNGDRIVLLYSSGVNNLSDSYNQGFIAGFFCSADLGFAGGNNAEMFYLLVPDPDGVFTADGGDGIGKGFVRTTTDNTVAHEFQHLINAWRRINAGVGPMDVWLNEGLSHLAEEVVGHADVGNTPGTGLGQPEILGDQDKFNTWYRNDFINLATYLAIPDGMVGLVTTEDPLGSETFRMRGSAWSFLRYLLDRFETAGTEAARARSLVVNSASDARDAVAAEFGTSFDVLAADWNAMFAVVDRSDLGGVPRAGLQLPSYELREIYDFPSFASFIDSVLGSLGFPQPGGYPLIPAQASLTGTLSMDADLYTATAKFLRLTSGLDTDGTGLRVQAQGTGDDVSAADAVRTIVIRTK
jgi:hypothetical protein